MMKPPQERRIVLIGEAPGANTQANAPLFPAPASSAGARLKALTGLGTTDYLCVFQRANLLYENPGRRPSGTDKWPTVDARRCAATAWPLLCGRTVILVGRRVADAFFPDPAREFPILEWWEQHPHRTHLDPPVTVACIPHTSGRNHWYNKPGNRELVEKFLRKAIGVADFSDESL